jgi:hypothetical protein
MARHFLHGSETSVLLELTGLAERRLSLEEGLRSVFLSLLTLCFWLVPYVDVDYIADISETSTASIYFQSIVSVFLKMTTVSETSEVQSFCMGVTSLTDINISIVPPP